MSDHSKLTLWGQLGGQTRLRLASASGISLLELEEISGLAERVMTECRGVAWRPAVSEEVKDYLCQTLNGLQGLARGDGSEMVYLLPHLQSFLPPRNWLRARRQLLAMISDIDILVDQRGRGKPRVDAQRLTDAAESLLEIWTDYTGRPLGRGKDINLPLGFYGVLLPRAPVPGNERQYEEDWPSDRIADADEWSVNPHQTIAIDTLSDEVLGAMPRAIRRVNRNARNHK